MNCRTFGKWRTGRTCAEGTMSWTKFEMVLYSLSRNTGMKTVV